MDKPQPTDTGQPIVSHLPFVEDDNVHVANAIQSNMRSNYNIDESTAIDDQSAEIFWMTDENGTQLRRRPRTWSASANQRDSEVIITLPELLEGGALERLAKQDVDGIDDILQFCEAFLNQLDDESNQHLLSRTQQ